MEDRGTPVYIWVVAEDTENSRYYFEAVRGTTQVIEMSVPIGWSLVSTEYGVRLRDVYGNTLSPLEVRNRFRVRSFTVVDRYYSGPA